jgi:chromosome segregation ATPase
MPSGSQSGASTPGGSQSLVARLSRQVERLDAESRQREHEKQELQAELRERDARIVRIEGEMKHLRQGQRESADLEVLKELRGRVQALEEDVHRRDVELVDRSEHITRLQRQLGATSAPGSAMSFLNDLLGAKDKYSEEAQRAKEEAALMKQRIEHVSQQNQDKEKLIRELEAARLSLSGKAQQEGQEAEELRERVKSLEGMLEAQLGSVMDQLVDAMHRNEQLVADCRDTRTQLSASQEETRLCARQVQEREAECARTAAELAKARAEVGHARAARRTDALALRERSGELVQVLEEAQTQLAALRAGCEGSEARSAALAQVLMSVCLPVSNKRSSDMSESRCSCDNKKRV